jgi:hypothetical protein
MLCCSLDLLKTPWSQEELENHSPLSVSINHDLVPLSLLTATTADKQGVLVGK